ncbi:CrcB-like protein-domain-containing protein [Papiliotrema laurentii]|uniref:CrcB-like protein-domain-containing protein n=1 Tax=Papiliotrema laurentii TaxID=5418 RepID=A0AAD9CVV8_PAPLA|nr:CrcB-like protein-domain-containing protein [Papiliotrema laurentii]
MDFARPDAATSPTLVARRTSKSQLSPPLRQDPGETDVPSEPPSPSSPKDISPSSELLSPSRVLAHYTGLVLASMIGCLIRLGLDGLADYNGAIIFPLAWSQGVGCAIMGLAVGKKNEIILIYPPLYTFITTGVAGSVTTFSSWMLEGYLSFSNFYGYNRGGLHDTVDGVGYSFATWLIALGALHVGDHFATILPPLHSISASAKRSNLIKRSQDVSSSETKHMSEPIRRKDRVTQPTPILDYLVILSSALSYLVALLLYFFGPTVWRHRATFPILFAPPGAILRFALAKLNPLKPFINKFPLGTFLANIIATLVISGVFAAQRLPSAGGSGTRCNALYAIQQGFCGCLSTVSTFVVESRSIKQRRWKWIYVGISVVLGQVCVLAIVGGVGWSQGYVEVCGE